MQIVHGQNNSHIFILIELFEDVEDLNLVFDIKGGGRLIKNHYLWFLSDSSSDYHPLFFSTADFIESALGKL